MIRKFLILFLLYAGQLNAQHTFYKGLDLPFNTKFTDAIELDDGYILCGYDMRTYPIGDNLLLVKIDKYGNQIWNQTYDIDSSSVYRSILDNGDGFFVGGYRIKNNDGAIKLISKYDYEGNLIWEKEYGEKAVVAFENLLRDIEHFQDGLIVGASVFDSDNGTADAQLFKVDQNGNVLWKNHFGLDEGDDHYGDSVLKIASTKNAIYCYFFSFRSNGDTYRTLLKTDLNGNEIWRKALRGYHSILNPYYMNLEPLDFTILPNGNALLLFSDLYFTHFEEVGYTTANVFIELSADGEEVRLEVGERISPIETGDIRFNSDGEILITGSQDKDTTDNLGIQLFVAKYSADYELIWEHHYGEQNQNDLADFGLLTRDNGMLVVGNYLDITKVKQQAILLKTDCQGRIEWNYDACLDPDKPELNIFPNPFTNTINIHIPWVELTDKIEVELVAVTGQSVFKGNYLGERVIQVGDLNLAAGMYIALISINNEQQLVEKLICR